MQTASAPSPVRGLAIALLLGVVLAAAAVGFLASVPSSLELTGASQSSPSTNQTKTTQGGQAGASVPTSSNNTTSWSSVFAVVNSTSPSIMSVGDIAAAISGGKGVGASNSSISGSTSENASNAALTYGQERSATVATAWRDLAIFAAAGALASAVFLLSRRRVS